MPYVLRLFALLTLPLLLQTGCAGPDAEESGQLPGLFAIMAGLEQDLVRISRGIWLEDFALIQAGAASVADHPMVPPEELERVSAALGPDLARFKEWDMEVHELAVRMSESPAAEGMEPVLALDAELRAGCVGCHSEFRERLRQAIR